MNEQEAREKALELWERLCDVYSIDVNDDGPAVHIIECAFLGKPDEIRVAKR